MSSLTKRKMSLLVYGATVITVGTLISRLLGLVKDNMIYNFTGEMVKSAYRDAFIVPDFLYNLLAGGALAAAFIPIFSRLLQEDKVEESNKTASSVINIVSIGVMVGLIIIFAFAPELVSVIAQTKDLHQFNLTIILTREMCVMVIFTALSGLFTGILQSYKNYMVPVIIWVLYNVFSILGVTLFSKIPNSSVIPSCLHITGDTIGVHGLALGVVSGAVAMALLQLPSMYKNGFRYYPIIDLRIQSVREIGVLFLPAMIGIALSQFNMLTAPQIMAKFVDGMPLKNVVYSANRLVLLPMGLFAISIATAAFPILSRLGKPEQKEEFVKIFNESLRSILLFIIPCGIGLFVIAYPIIMLLYSGDNSGYTSLQSTSLVLVTMVFSLFGLAVLQIVNRGFYATKNTLIPVTVNTAMVVGNIVLSYFLITQTPLGLLSIGISTTSTSVAAAVILYCLFAKRIGGIDGRATLNVAFKMFISACIMGIVVLIISHITAPHVLVGENIIKISPLSSDWLRMPDLKHPIMDAPTAIGSLSLRMNLIFQVGLSMFIGMIVYFAMLIAFRVPGAVKYVNKLLIKLRLRKSESEL